MNLNPGYCINVLKIRVIILTILFPVIAFSQEEDSLLPPPEVYGDSIFSEQPAEPEFITQDTNFFQPITPGDLQLPVIRQVPDSVIRDLQNQDIFWYANENFVKEKKEKQTSSTLLEAQWFKSLMWFLVVAAFISAIVWYLVTSNFRFFHRRSMAINKSKDTEETEDIFSIKYHDGILKAVNEGNFRLATRLHYLQLLKELSERNIIHYKQDLTNFDYLMQLYSTGYYKDFFRLTRNYEFAWYGKLDPGKEGYNIIRREFDEFSKRYRH